nr:hypothetical protein [Tanacetum cinerariifolium]
MTSFGYRSNPRYAIKECSSCGTLYTRDCGCLKGNIEDKILVPKPPKNCARAGEACKRCTCAKCGSGLGKGLCYICGHNQNSLNDSPSISKTSSQSPPNISHCCYECGDPLDGIFCKQCACKFCEKDAHIGYNCPSKVSVISNPKPCNNQTIDELPQTLPIFHPTFHYEAESPFTLDSTPTYVDESPNIFNPPPQSPVYPCEFCGNDSYYGNVEDKILVPKLLKNCARCARCGHPVDGSYCQGCALLRQKLEKDLVTYFQDFQNTSESSNDSINVVNAQREPFVVKKDHGVNSLQNPPHVDECCCECGDALDGIFCQQCIISLVGKNRPAFYKDDDDDDVDYTIAITPVLSIKELDNSLSMRDEHLDTILTMESDEVIKSSVEDLVSIPSESEGIPDTMCDMHLEEFADKLAHIISPSEYDCFYFGNLPDPGEWISILNSRIRENLSSITRVNLPVEDDHSPLLAYVVWIFLAYLTYPVIPPYLHSFRNEDTIFDPGIAINHFYSFKLGLSHRCGTFKKFSTHRSHLNESLMEMLFSTCFPMDQ